MGNGRTLRVGTGAASGMGLVVLACALTACAVGAETPTMTTFGGPAPNDTGDNEPQTTGTTVSEPDDGTTFMPDGSDDDFDTTGLADEGTTGEPMSDSSSDDGGESSSDDGGSDLCTNETTCPTAGAIGGVSGDTGFDALAINGADPTWLTFEVSEDDSDVVGAAMSFTATLTSPPGADFDLYVYRGPEGGSSGCGGFMSASVTTGVDTVSMGWGEGLVANGVDDDVWVAVEIVPKDGICVQPDEWTLTVHGNT